MTSPCTHTYDDYLKRSPQQCIWPPHPFLFPIAAAAAALLIVFPSSSVREEARERERGGGAREVCGRRSCKFFTSQELGQRLKWLRSLSISPMQCLSLFPFLPSTQTWARHLSKSTSHTRGARQTSLGAGRYCEATTWLMHGTETDSEQEIATGSAQRCWHIRSTWLEYLRALHLVTAV